MLHHLSIQRGLATDRNHRCTDQNGQHDDGDAIVADNGVEEMEHPDQRFGKPREPPVTYGGLQPVLFQKFGFFRAGENGERLLVCRRRGVLFVGLQNQRQARQAIRNVDSLSKTLVEIFKIADRSRIGVADDEGTVFGVLVRDQRDVEVLGVDAHKIQCAILSTAV